MRVIITGASRGIGEQIARLLAKKHYTSFKMILVARSEDKLKKIASELNAEYFICDLSREEELERLIRTYPTTDMLINNAALADYGYYHNLTWENTKKVITVNAIVPAKLCHHYLKDMVERNYGYILNVASADSLGPIPFKTAYVSTKAFLINFTRSLMLELKDTNIKISCLMPGPTDTDLWNFPVKSRIKINKMKPRKVAEYAVKLLEKGGTGIPGFGNKIRKMAKLYLPEKLHGYLIRHLMLLAGADSLKILVDQNCSE